MMRMRMKEGEGEGEDGTEENLTTSTLTVGNKTCLKIIEQYINIAENYIKMIENQFRTCATKDFKDVPTCLNILGHLHRTAAGGIRSLEFRRISNF